MNIFEEGETEIQNMLKQQADMYHEKTESGGLVEVGKENRINSASTIGSHRSQMKAYLKRAPVKDKESWKDFVNVSRELLMK